MQATKLQKCRWMAEAENLPLCQIKSGKQAVSSARLFAIAANIRRASKKPITRNLSIGQQLNKKSRYSTNESKRPFQLKSVNTLSLKPSFILQRNNGKLLGQFE